LRLQIFDTRRLTQILRIKGAQAGAILTGEDATEEKARELINAFGSMVGKDLAKGSKLYATL